MVSHIPYFIERFGCPKNFTSDSFEMGHRFHVKNLYKLTNKGQDAMDQMLNKLSTQEACLRIFDLHNLGEDVSASEIPMDDLTYRSEDDDDEDMDCSEKTSSKTKIIFAKGDPFHAAVGLPADLDEQRFENLCKDFLLREFEDLGQTLEEQHQSLSEIIRTCGERMWTVCRSKKASFDGGILRASPEYNDAQDQRFDCVSAEAFGKISFWYGKLALFVQIGDFSGALVRWFTDDEVKKAAVYSFLKPLKWSFAQDCYSIIPLSAIESRVHIVPDFSNALRYLKSHGLTASNKDSDIFSIPIQNQRFFLNQPYILL
jgi:hypothetical protein